MQQKSSYSSQLKQQIIVSDIKNVCCAVAELSAFIKLQGESIFISTDKSYIRRINGLASKAKSAEVEKRCFFVKNKKGVAYYGMEVKMPKTAGLNNVNKKDCCINAFLRGCFLHSGYIASPDKSARAELAFKDLSIKMQCEELLESCSIPFNKAERDGRHILYIKSIEGVSAFLAHIGAIGAMLEFENRNIIKKGNSDANRMMNCDNANLDKSVEAAARQVALISKFMKTSSFETIPEQLKEIAVLRVENEALSLKELGLMITPNLSKSGVAHRLKKLEEIANKKFSQ